MCQLSETLKQVQGDDLDLFEDEISPIVGITNLSIIQNVAQRSEETLFRSKILEPGLKTD